LSARSKGSRRIWRDLDDAPEITGKWIAEADLYHRGKKLVRGGPARRVRKNDTGLP
jgi:hypothetical protein